MTTFNFHNKNWSLEVPQFKLLRPVGQLKLFPASNYFENISYVETSGFINELFNFQQKTVIKMKIVYNLGSLGIYDFHIVNNYV